jgi:hypothetical protein
MAPSSLVSRKRASSWNDLVESLVSCVSCASGGGAVDRAASPLDSDDDGEWLLGAHQGWWTLANLPEVRCWGLLVLARANARGSSVWLPPAGGLVCRCAEGERLQRRCKLVPSTTAPPSHTQDIKLAILTWFPDKQQALPLRAVCKSWLSAFNGCTRTITINSQLRLLPASTSHFPALGHLCVSHTTAAAADAAVKLLGVPSAATLSTLEISNTGVRLCVRLCVSARARGGGAVTIPA